MANHIWEGRCSWFGGPNDKGVGSGETLALVDKSSLSKFAGYFLDHQPTGTTGLARRANPNTHYIACRWVYKETSKKYLQSIRVTVENIKTGEKFTDVRPLDWGPNKKTGRVADLSPKLMHDLKLDTDGHVRVTIPLPEPKKSS